MFESIFVTRLCRPNIFSACAKLIRFHTFADVLVWWPARTEQFWTNPGFARLASDSAAEVEKCQGSWISDDFNSCDTFNTVLGQGQEEIRALRCRNREFPKRNSVSAFSTWVIGAWHRLSQQEMQKELEVRYSEPIMFGHDESRTV